MNLSEYGAQAKIPFPQYHSERTQCEEIPKFHIISPGCFNRFQQISTVAGFVTNISSWEAPPLVKDGPLLHARSARIHFRLVPQELRDVGPNISLQLAAEGLSSHVHQAGLRDFFTVTGLCY